MVLFTAWKGNVTHWEGGLILGMERECNAADVSGRWTV